MNTKSSFNLLNEFDKKRIIENYYIRKDLNFRELSDLLSVSERAVSRVLMEANINTKKLNRYTLDENYFDKIDSDEKAYILGMLYADGFVGDEKFNNIVLSLNDKEMVEKIGSLLKFTGEIRLGKKGGFKNSRGSYILNFSSLKMANDLRKIGLYPNKSLTIEALPKIDGDLFRHFVRGYFDGDGSIILSHHTSYHRVGGITKKYIYPAYTFMLLGTLRFLENIIARMEVEHYIITNTKTEQIKCLRVNAKCELKNLFEYLYNNSNLCLQRKYNKWLEVKSAFMV